MATTYNRLQFLETVEIEGEDSYISPISGNYIRFLSLLKHDNQYLITDSDSSNLPLISFRNYGNIDLWWVIGVYNGIKNPFTELTAGTLINIPTITSINDYFEAMKKNNANANKVVVLS